MSRKFNILAAFLMIAGLGFGLTLGATKALHSSWFDLKFVEVEKLSPDYPLTEKEVLQLAQVTVVQIAAEGSNLFELDLKPIESRILKNHWVKGVVLSKQMPNTLSIKIVERNPIALLSSSSGQTLYLEKDSAIFRDHGMIYSKDLPILSGFRTDANEALKQASRFIETWFDSQKLPGLNLSSLSYDEKLGLRAVITYPLKNGQKMRTILEMGLNIDDANRVSQERLLRVLKHLSNDSLSASKIWLGEGKKLVVKISRPSSGNLLSQFDKF